MKKVLLTSLLSVVSVASVFAGCSSCRPARQMARPACAPCAQPKRVVKPQPTPVVAPQPVVEHVAAVRAVQGGSIIHVHSVEQFNDLIKTGNVIVKFGNDLRCNPCRQLTPKLAKIAAEYSDIKVLSVNNDELSSLLPKNSSIPVMQFYKNGVQVAAPVVGNQSEATIKNMIKNNFGL